MYGKPACPVRTIGGVVQDDRAAAAVDDLALLLVALIAFSLFFASLAGAYVLREQERRAARLQAIAEALVSATLDEPAWTEGHARLLASGLANGSEGGLADLAASHPFRVVVRDLAHERTWTFARGDPGGDARSAVASANVVSDAVDPARVTATVWGS